MPTNPTQLVEKNYYENITYFETYHENIYSKLSELEIAIDKGYYTPKYELIFENDSFDVIELSSNNSLYNKDESSYSSLATKSIDFTIEENCFKLINTINEEFYTLIDSKSPKQKEVQKLNKFIFFGLGLATHISPIIKKSHISSCLLVEDDLELFRLSLFTTNYKIISQKCILFFSIFDDNSQFLENAKVFLAHQSYYNSYIKFFAMLNHSEDKIKQFQLLISSQPHMMFLYKDLLLEDLKPLENFKENYTYLIKQKSFTKNKKPFLLLAAGPSLQKNIQWVQQQQANFFIVAISSILEYLREKDIQVDLIIHLDSLGGANVHFEKIQDYDFFNNALALFSSKTSSKILQKFNKEKLFLFETGTRYKLDSLKPAAPCVGSLSYQLLLLLGAKNIYFLGLDLAIDSISGATHSSSHSYSQELDISTTIENEHSIEYKKSLFSIAANFGMEVLTTPHFRTSIDSINQSTSYFKDKDQNVYNLSNGAKSNDITPLNINNIFINSDLNEKLSLDGSTFNENDKKNLNKRISQAKDLQDYLALIQKKDITNSDTFTKQFQEIYYKIKDEDKLIEYEVYKILDSYIEYSFPHIFNVLNRKNFDLDIAILINLKNIVLSKMTSITDRYIFALEK